MKSMLREPITAIDGADMVIFFLNYFLFSDRYGSSLFSFCLVVFGHVVDSSFQMFGHALVCVLFSAARDWGIWGWRDFGWIFEPSGR